MILGATALVAGIVGVWFGFNFSYQPSAQVVVYGFPVPGAFHVLETYDDGTQQWVDFVTAAPFLAAVANACLLLSIPVALVWLVHFLASRIQRPSTPRAVG